MDKDEKGLIIIVVGGNFGSEGKGRHVEVLTKHRLRGKIDIAVRTGAPNAGHTVYKDNKPYPMQAIPCSWIDPECRLILGAGAQVSPHILAHEIETLGKYLAKRRIVVDQNAIIQDDTTMEEEKERGMHGRMGSTAEGCGVALERRIKRDGSVITFGQWEEMKKRGPTRHLALDRLLDDDKIEIRDTVELLNNAYDKGSVILLEGTQGAGLSLFHTPDYPHATSRDTNAANWLAEAGLSPNLNCEIHMVIRTYPIRVAGKSGYLPNELSWPAFLRKTFAPIDENIIIDFEDAIELAERKAKNGMILWNDTVITAIGSLSKGHQDILRKFVEITTVTKKVRRISDFDFSFYQKYIRINRPDIICLQFADYLDRVNCKEIAGAMKSDLTYMPRGEIKEVFNFTLNRFLDQMDSVGAPVKFMGIDSKHTISIL